MNMMGNIDCFLENPRQSNGEPVYAFVFIYMYYGFHFTVVGPVEADPEYQLIVDSNNMAVEIDNETSKPYVL